MFGRQVDRSIPDAAVREPCLASLRVPEAAGHTVGEIEFVAEDVRLIRDPVVSSSGHLIFRRALTQPLDRGEVASYQREQPCPRQAQPTTTACVLLADCTQEELGCAEERVLLCRRETSPSWLLCDYPDLLGPWAQQLQDACCRSTPGIRGASCHLQTSPRSA